MMRLIRLESDIRQVLATDAQILNAKALLGCLYKYEGNGLSDFQTFGLSSSQMRRFLADG